jgi:N-acetyl-anhydromuramyl-L-alanine amidase AmpD
MNHRKLLNMFLVFLLLHSKLTAQTTANAPDLNRYFAEAYQLYPAIPQGTLEATAFAASHMQNLQVHAGSDHSSCMGMPERFGLFGLIEDGKGYFKNNLAAVCAVSGITAEQYKKDLRLQILAVARFLQQEAVAQNKTARSAVENFAGVLEKLSEIPEDGTPINSYARTLYTYEIYHHLQEGFITPQVKIVPRKVQLDKIYPGATLRLLQAPGVRINYDNNLPITPTNNNPAARENGANDVAEVLSADYPPAIWDQAHTNNFATGRNGVAVTNVTVHTAQGTYAGTISWFNNGNIPDPVSAHYVIRSSDGQVTQMVREADRAWHVRNHNSYTVGIEHEGWVNDATWYTNNMYNSSAALVRDICSSHNINKAAVFPGPATSTVNYQPVTVRIKGHQHYDGNSHTDPGINWNWAKYKALINPTTTVTTITFNAKNQETGVAIGSASVSIKRPNGTTSTATTDASGKLVFGADTGRFEFTFSKSGYTSLKTFFIGGPNATITADINLDPVSAARIATDAVVPTSPHADNQMTIQGYVRDAAVNMPVAGAQVRAGLYTANTDNKGFFSIIVPATPVVQTKTPGVMAIQISKDGYTTRNIQNFHVIPDTYTVPVALNPASTSNGRVQQAEETEIFTHGLFDRTATDEHASHEESNATARETEAAAVAATVPASIRVVTSCACSTCTTVQVQVMSLESYVETGVDDEWVSSWNAASLQAGAVAYRSKGAWYILHPVAANYDLSSAACHQTWQTDRATSVKNAAIATAGVVLVKDGAIFKAEYCAESNNAGCGDGFSGTGTDWPCIADARCAGRANNGHGRGMCQWGSSFWGTDQNYTWILNHYYNPGGVTIQTAAGLVESPNGNGTQTARTLQVAPNPVTGSSITVEYNLEEAAQAATVVITDSYGTVAQQRRVSLQSGNNRLTIPASSLKAGIYTITIRLQSGGKSKSNKIVVVK